MFVIGITGGIGSGKSTVAALCREAGLPVLDADRVSHSVTLKGGSALPEIIEYFGDDCLDAEGNLDRKHMAELVFRDKKALDQLSLIIHRHVLDTMGEQLKELAKSGEKAAVMDVPIPVKHGFLDRCDQVWAVWADDEIRLDRLEHRGLEREEAERRMKIQMTREQYAELADIEIENNGDFEQIREQVDNLLQKELGSRGLPVRSLR